MAHPCGSIAVNHPLVKHDPLAPLLLSRPPATPHFPSCVPNPRYLTTRRLSLTLSVSAGSQIVQTSGGLSVEGHDAGLDHVFPSPLIARMFMLQL